LTRVWAKRGARPAAPRDQRRIWAYILGAVCPARRATSALVMPYLNATAVSAHLADISRAVAEGAQAVLVLDGAGFHVAKDLKIPRNITLLRLPPYSPELNPIENVWEYLRGNKFANTVYETYDELVTACCNAWNFFVEDPERIASVTTRSWAKVNT
jgi:transposase